MTLNLNLLLLLLGSLQGLLLTAFLVRKKIYHSGYIFLIIYINVIVLQTTLKLVSRTWVTEDTKNLYWLTYQFPFLYGPLVYLLTRNLLIKKPFRGIDVLHFAPFMIILADFMIANFRFSSLTASVYLDPKWRLIFQLASVCTYHAISLFYWRKHIGSLKDPSQLYHLQLKWLQNFLYGSFGVCIITVVIVYIMSWVFPVFSIFRYGFVAQTVFIYWVSYIVFSRPKIFRVTRGGLKGELSAKDKISPLVVHRSKKYKSSGLETERALEIVARLNRLMQVEKLFLETGITIDGLANRIPCSRHHLSQVLNDRLGQNFYDYINNFRVNEAKCLLSDNSRIHEKIASIAYDAGFNSLSTFNEVFRKIAGVTPSQYRKQLSEEFRKQRI